MCQDMQCLFMRGFSFLVLVYEFRLYGSQRVGTITRVFKWVPSDSVFIAIGRIHEKSSAWMMMGVGGIISTIR